MPDGWEGNCGPGRRSITSMGKPLPFMPFTVYSELATCDELTSSLSSLEVASGFKTRRHFSYIAYRSNIKCVLKILSKLTTKL